MSSNPDGEPVELYVYDLTHGIASALSPVILGHKIDGVWHTSIVVYGREHFYGAKGINTCAPGSTQLGPPLQVERIGHTHVPAQLLDEYMQGLSNTTYTGQVYNLLTHNCNNFTEELAQFLCGGHIPKHILELPERAISPQLRASLQNILEQILPAPTTTTTAARMSYDLRLRRQDSPEYLTLNTEIEEARVSGQALEQRRSTLAEKLARKERRQEKKRKKMNQTGEGEGLHMDVDTMSEVTAVGVAVAGPSCDQLSEMQESEREEERREEELRSAREPPVVYKHIDPESAMSSLESALSGAPLGEGGSLGELRLYLVEGEGSWVLGDEWGVWAGEVLREGGAAAVALLQCLACCALKDDVSLLLHQDRRTHALTNYAFGIDKLPVPEQRGVALFFCNLFEHVGASEWLLYISEWEQDRQPLSNIRVTTKVSVHALLSDDEELFDIGSALMHNIAIKEVKTVRFLKGKSLRDLLPRQAKSKVFDDVCVELAMAVLQFLSSAPAEEQLYRSCRTLARLAQHSQEVPKLITMLGVQPKAFRGTSPRVDEQLTILLSKVKPN